MKSSSQVLRAAVAYRQLMKAVKQHVGREGHKSHFTGFIAQQFRKRNEQLDSVQQKLKLARD